MRAEGKHSSSLKPKPGLVSPTLVAFLGDTCTRIRDQERSPIAADLKGAMREKAELGQPTFALTADVSEAHRQVPVHPSDWHFLGCQVTKGSTVYVNTVGILGITSASYYWNRVGAAVGRISQYVVGKSATTWHMLVADDYHLEAGGEQYRFALIAFFIVCAVAGVPLSWNKTSCGESVTWVGFELLHKTRSSVYLRGEQTGSEDGRRRLQIPVLFSRGRTGVREAISRSSVQTLRSPPV